MYKYTANIVRMMETFDIYEKIQAKLKKTKAIVFEILKNDVRCREDDCLLMYTVFKYKIPDIENKPFNLELWRQMYESANTETIRRNRAHIQNNLKLFKPENSVQDNRSLAEYAWKHFFSN